MEVLSILKQSLVITFFVFAMMLLVDFIDTAGKSRLSETVKKGPWRQYSLASFLGATPGCLGAFMNVSLYVHGMITFGALVASMIATSGDEAFVMLAQFPGTACMLFVALFTAGIIFGWVSDKLVSVLKFTPCETCSLHQCEEGSHHTGDSQELRHLLNLRDLVANLRNISFARFLLVLLIVSFLSMVLMGRIGPMGWNWKRITFVCLALCSLHIVVVTSEHYLVDHIWEHIFKRHLVRVFLWSLGALLLVHWGLSFWNLADLVRQNMLVVLLLGALMGVLPESGPHLVFVMLFAEELIPFSILFTSSFVQDGHGTLPLLSNSVKDWALLKTFNLVFGLIVGGVLFALGL